MMHPAVAIWIVYLERTEVYDRSIPHFMYHNEAIPMPEVRHLSLRYSTPRRKIASDVCGALNTSPVLSRKEAERLVAGAGYFTPEFGELIDRAKASLDAAMKGSYEAIILGEDMSPVNFIGRVVERYRGARGSNDSS